MKPSELADRMLEPDWKWIQGSLRDEQGGTCLMGRIYQQDCGFGFNQPLSRAGVVLFREIRETIEEAFGYDEPADYNDADDTTEDDVRAVVEKGPAPGGGRGSFNCSHPLE